MKKTRKTHLWIGLICSVFILIESITGLLMNEPWLIGQSSQLEGNRGDFQPGQFNRQFNQGTAPQGTTPDASQAAGQTNGQTNANGQTQGQNGTTPNMQFPGQARPGGEGMSQGTFMSTIRGLHEGKIGNTNVKWLIDLVALALIFLTCSGIYLSLKVLRVGKSGKGKTDGYVA
jgi:hypothetical protein